MFPCIVANVVDKYVVTVLGEEGLYQLSSPIFLDHAKSDQIWSRARV